MPDEKLIKIRYIDEDEMHLVMDLGDPVTIKKGDVKEFTEEMAQRFLRDTKTVIKKGKVIEIPKWEPVKEGKE